MQIKDITAALEQWAPLSLQENYDNAGLIIGDKASKLKGLLITLDVTEEVIDEAISRGANLIVAHHPLIFVGIKNITPGHWLKNCIIKAIKADIAIYAIHTNLDNVLWGVNDRIAQLLDLTNRQILSPARDKLCKLVTFVPNPDKDHVLNALYQAGAGAVGNYEHCSFQLDGTGTFKPGVGTQPVIGEVGHNETVNETRIEVLLPIYQQTKVLQALKKAHPYEEVAYYLQPLLNVNQEIGSGMTGELIKGFDAREFLDYLKTKMNLKVVKHTRPIDRPVQKVAICGGSGSFLLKAALASQAEVFITSDFKYHEFFEANSQIMIVDIGHYESEVYTKDLIHDFLNEKFANIAVHLSEVNTNPIQYY